MQVEYARQARGTPESSDIFFRIHKNDLNNSVLGISRRQGYVGQAARST